ncbi:hypothetical protein GCM10009425_23780 [Pseudomonas asuensis]|uniref:Uncharacterized protein n=1 Tax=Pseudomonas asuensis TaxID=1825787 RepID=A0ABQ2GUN2_9PSED|nr:hypothetical protein GCM10009425_23780 [Pseudomonas asuensis]
MGVPECSANKGQLESIGHYPRLLTGTVSVVPFYQGKYSVKEDKGKGSGCGSFVSDKKNLSDGERSGALHGDRETATGESGYAPPGMNWPVHNGAARNIAEEHEEVTDTCEPAASVGAGNAAASWGYIMIGPPHWSIF